MILAVIILLFVLWFLGIIHFPLSDQVLFTIGGVQVTLVNLIIFSLLLWVIGLLPSPFRQIVTVVLVLWLLSLFGIIAISGFSQMLVIALVIGLGVYLIRDRF